MKLPRLDLESKLLLVATGACVWAPVRLICMRGLTNQDDLFLLIGLGGILATLCETNGRHAVGRLAVISTCFAMAAAVVLIAHMEVILVLAWGAGAVAFAVSAIEMFRKTRRGRISSSQTAIPPTLSVSLPMMPIRDMVIVPGTTTPLLVGRESSVRALESALANDQMMFLATQNDASNDEPKANEISRFGCVCKILQNVKMPNGNVKVSVEGMGMAKAIGVDGSSGFFIATLHPVNADVGVA